MVGRGGGEGLFLFVFTVNHVSSHPRRRRRRRPRRLDPLLLARGALIGSSSSSSSSAESEGIISRVQVSCVCVSCWLLQLRDKGGYFLHLAPQFAISEREEMYFVHK